jgi:hypothetical protein
MGPICGKRCIKLPSPRKGNEFYFYVTFALVVEKVITQLSLPMTFKDEEWVDGSLPIPT